MLRFSRLKGAAVLGVVSAVILFLVPTAGASHLQSGMSISVGDSPKLVNGVYLVVPVTITCPPLGLTPTQWINQESASVQVTEKVGKVLTSGYGQIGFSANGPDGPFFGTPLTCDGVPHAYAVNVFPQSASQGAPVIPFKGGKAVVSAYFFIFVQDSSTFQGDSNEVDVGPASISIKG